jgi:hypothetical protein
MKLPKFTKLPEYKKFNYSPLYYDSKKEELNQKMKAAVEKKLASESGSYQTDLKGKFKHPRSNNKTKQQLNASKLRFGLIIIFLAVLLYVLFKKGNIIEKMMEVLFSG